MTPQSLETLRKLSTLLSKVHKEIIEFEFRAYEEAHKVSLSTGTRLQLLLHGQEFLWLRPLSQLMSNIDGILFQKEEVLREQIDEVRKSLERIFLEKGWEAHAARVRVDLENIKAVALKL